MKFSRYLITLLSLCVVPGLLVDARGQAEDKSGKESQGNPAEASVEAVRLIRNLDWDTSSAVDLKGDVPYLISSWRELKDGHTNFTASLDAEGAITRIDFEWKKAGEKAAEHTAEAGHFLFVDGKFQEKVLSEIKQADDGARNEANQYLEATKSILHDFQANREKYRPFNKIRTPLRKLEQKSDVNGGSAKDNSGLEKSSFVPDLSVAWSSTWGDIDWEAGQFDGKNYSLSLESRGWNEETNTYVISGEWQYIGAPDTKLKNDTKGHAEFHFSSSTTFVGKFSEPGISPHSPWNWAGCLPGDDRFVPQLTFDWDTEAGGIRWREETFSYQDYLEWDWMNWDAETGNFVIRGSHGPPGVPDLRYKFRIEFASPDSFIGWDYGGNLKLSGTIAK